MEVVVMRITSTVTFTPGRAVQERLDSFAKSSGISVSKVIRECLSFALEKVDTTKPGIVFKG